MLNIPEDLRGQYNAASSPFGPPDVTTILLIERIAHLESALAKADKMRDWFMHTVPEWDKSTQKAIDEYEQARRKG